jgi:uncharacterized protein YgbK (DUF1537 family)
VYLGHLFVGGVLLSESSLRTHPLTPMTDANLVRVLGQQTRHAVGLVPYAVVDRGATAVAAALRDLTADGVRHAVVDAVAERHLAAIADATRERPLVTGASALAAHLAAAYRALGVLPDAAPVPPPPRRYGRTLVVAGSCSDATRAQVARYGVARRVFHVDPVDVLARHDVVSEAIAADPDLVASTLPAGDVTAESAAAVEDALAEISAALVAKADVRRLVVAGGETAGAVATRLGATVLRVGAELAPGIPWCVTDDGLVLVLKSGNFGGPDFFAEAAA